MDALPDANEIELLKLYFGSEPETASGTERRCSRSAERIVAAWRRRKKRTTKGLPPSLSPAEVPLERAGSESRVQLQHPDSSVR